MDIEATVNVLERMHLDGLPEQIVIRKDEHGWHAGELVSQKLGADCSLCPGDDDTYPSLVECLEALLEVAQRLDAMKKCSVSRPELPGWTVNENETNERYVRLDHASGASICNLASYPNEWFWGHSALEYCSSSQVKPTAAEAAAAALRFVVFHVPNVPETWWVWQRYTFDDFRQSNRPYDSSERAALDALEFHEKTSATTVDPPSDPLAQEDPYPTVSQEAATRMFWASQADPNCESEWVCPSCLGREGTMEMCDQCGGNGYVMSVEDPHTYAEPKEQSRRSHNVRRGHAPGTTVALTPSQGKELVEAQLRELCSAIDEFAHYFNGRSNGWQKIMALRENFRKTAP